MPNEVASDWFHSGSSEQSIRSVAGETPLIVYFRPWGGTSMLLSSPKVRMRAGTNSLTWYVPPPQEASATAARRPAAARVAMRLRFSRKDIQSPVGILFGRGSGRGSRAEGRDHWTVLRAAPR